MFFAVNFPFSKEEHKPDQLFLLLSNFCVVGMHRLSFLSSFKSSTHFLSDPFAFIMSSRT
jgi:hypothetical protein